LTSRRNKKYFIASVWVIVVGIILWLCGVIINGGLGVFYGMFNWFDTSHTITDNVAIGLVWAGIILFIIGVFGMITALVKGRD
jgi:hypothetical protein